MIIYVRTVRSVIYAVADASVIPASIDAAVCAAFDGPNLKINPVYDPGLFSNWGVGIGQVTDQNSGISVINQTGDEVGFSIRQLVGALQGIAVVTYGGLPPVMATPQALTGFGTPSVIAEGFRTNGSRYIVGGAGTTASNRRIPVIKNGFALVDTAGVASYQSGGLAYQLATDNDAAYLVNFSAPSGSLTSLPMNRIGLSAFPLVPASSGANVFGGASNITVRGLADVTIGIEIPDIIWSNEQSALTDLYFYLPSGGCQSSLSVSSDLSSASSGTNNPSTAIAYGVSVATIKRLVTSADTSLSVGFGSVGSSAGNNPLIKLNAAVPNRIPCGMTWEVVVGIGLSSVTNYASSVYTSPIPVASFPLF